MSAETLPFDAEVRQLLDLVIHSLYSEREVFLRELVSNASDALDRARLIGLERPDLRSAGGDPGIDIRVDEATRTITITDNGIGLTAQQAREHLGTIARSGTKAFAQALKQGEEHNLIGQFGVGFYSALMVAEKVEVRSLSGEPEAEPIIWTCDGSTAYTLESGAPGRETRGTEITLHLREDASEFADKDRLQDIIKKYSEFVSYPIRIDGEQVNEPRALWTRAPSEVTEEEYKAFYNHVSGDYGEPATWLHLRAEAPMSYKAVLFFPASKPYDLNHSDGRRPLRLYARRVLIEEQARKLLPDWLRFIRGVVDSEDIQLNVSRELVQRTPLIGQLKGVLVSRILKHLKEWAEKEPEKYADFWHNFGGVLKEGIHAEAGQRDKLVELCRFNTTRHADGKGLISLEEYVSAMPEGQEKIWVLTGTDRDTLSRSPHLEGFRKKGQEVILLTDPVDEWVLQVLTQYKGKSIASVARGEMEKPERELAGDFLSWMKDLFDGQVSEVRASGRLTESAAVLVDEGWVSGNMDRILRAVGQGSGGAKRALEVNPTHPVVQAVERLHGAGRAGEAEPLARLLLDQARLAEGEVVDAAGLLSRMQRLGELAAKGLDAG